jgi:hypothetical protein
MIACLVETVLEVAKVLDNYMQQVALQDKGRLYSLASVMAT